jgi:histidine triad (HIT) family protein
VTADCLFCRIVAREIPAEVVHETEETLAFRDINPQAPTHIVVIPKAHFPDVASLATADPALAGAVLRSAAEIAQAEGIDSSGYRMVFNTGSGAGQTVFHVHCHLVGGRPMSWPPG